MERIQKMKVILFSALILLAGAGSLVTAVHFAQAAELNKTVYEPGVTAVPAEAEPVNFSEKAQDTPTALTTAMPTAIAPTPAPEYVAGQQAVENCVWTANNIFKMNIDENALTAKYVPAEESDWQHDQWVVEEPEFTCHIDAITGDVVGFSLPENTYNDEAITRSEYESSQVDYEKEITQNPDNNYLEAAKSIVSSRLAEGRSIEKTEVYYLTFFAADRNPDQPGNPAAKGTLLVGCKIYMDTGYCYDLLFLGISDPIVFSLYTYPDSLACSTSHYYNKMSADLGSHGAEFITGEEARDACIKTANDLFGMDVDVNTLSVRFNPKQEHKDQNGKLMYTTHDNWSISSFGFGCSIDAVSGDVISFEVKSDDYPGSSITEGDFSSSRYGPDLNDKGPNMYKNKAMELVETYLADGRKISEIMIDGVQFVWDDNSAGFDPNATGTIQVDCYVFLETGRCYTFSFWGTDEPILKIFFTYPNKNACLNGYYYEENAVD